ncbi:MAG: phosphate ABC transporter permease [Prochloraceae cyanobacterium]|nr:phosphate ABC transporter permease [Prochloraceae cyanobacterium]
MLVPLTREKFEQIIPLMATGPQYAYYWGKSQDCLRRVMISAVGAIVLLLLRMVLGRAAEGLTIVLGIIVGLYWLWAPVYWASMRNASYRGFPYSGFWRGRVLDVFVTEELVGEEETVNERGELVIIESRERRINLEVGDETGFKASLQAPLQRIHKGIARGEIVELLLLSNQPHLDRIAKITDAYLPSRNISIGDYPYLRLDDFIEVSRQLRGGGEQRGYKKNPRPSKIRRSSSSYDYR